MANEMGKSIRGWNRGGRENALAGDYYAENGAKFLSLEINRADEEEKPHVAFRPSGCDPRGDAVEFSVLAGSPLRSTGSDGGQCRRAETFGETFRAARWRWKHCFATPGSRNILFRALPISSKAVDAVIENPLIRAVSLTGSGPAGRAVAVQSGQVC